MSRLNPTVVAVGVGVVAIVTLSLWQRSVARRVAAENATDIVSVWRDLELELDGQMTLIAESHFEGQGIQRPISLAASGDGSLVVLDNEGALFSTSLVGNTFRPLVPISLQAPLDLPVAVEADGDKILVAVREGLSVVESHQAARSVTLLRSFAPIRYLAAAGPNLAVVSARGRVEPFVAIVEVGPEDLTWTDMDVSAQIDLSALNGAPPLVASCPDRAIVIHAPAASELLVYRPDLTFRTLHRLDDSFRALVARARPQRPLEQGSSPSLAAALSCTGGMIVEAPMLPWPTVIVFDLESGLVGEYGARVDLEGHHVVDVAVAEDLRTVFLLYVSASSQGRLLALALPPPAGLQHAGVGLVN